MIKRKFVATFLCAGLILALLTGCGSQKKTATGENKSNNTNTSENASKKVKLNIWAAQEDQQLMQEISDSFKEKYKGKAEFEINFQAQSESTCKDELVKDPEKGADIFTFVDDQLITLVAAGILEPVEAEKKVKEANSEETLSAVTVGKKIYAYPMTADNGYFMYYNKKYFSDKDLKKLDSMLKVAASNSKKISMDWSSGWYLYSFFGNTGLEVGLNKDGISNYCNWNAVDTPIKGIDVANAMLDIAKNPGFTNRVDKDFIKGVKDGSVIAGVSGVWNSKEIKEAWGNDYGAIKLPTYTCKGKQIQMGSFMGYKMVGVNAYSENRKWAEKFAQWMTNSENQLLRFKERGQGPADKTVADSKEVKEDEAIFAVMSQRENASLQRIGGEYWKPAEEFGMTLAKGNPQHRDLQELLDATVNRIIFTNAK